MASMTRLGTLPHRSRAVGYALAAALLLGGAAACTEERPQSNDPNVVAPGLADTVPGKAPLPAERCRKSGNAPAVKVVLTTSDGVHLAGVRFGSGARGVLLLPQKGIDFCPWWDYASELVTAGFHVLAIDLRGTGQSEPSDKADYTADAAAGVADLKQAGAAKVVLVGASQGGAVALVAAARLADQVAGVVALSYPDDAEDVTGGAGADPRTPAQAAPKLAAPLMVCFTTGDKLDDKARPQELVAQAPATAKELVGRAGVSHGWDMLKVGPDDVRPDILRFLQSYA
jgi:pimeloyl-ACP methyl ester carboxylesterase